MRRRAEVIKRCEERRVAVLAELHPILRPKIVDLLEEMRGRVTPWCGYRGPADQARAREDGHSNARFGESPHNYQPALACDVVLHPARVLLRPHAADIESPDLWDDETPDALATWEALERASGVVGLARIFLRGHRDRPHLELPEWRSLIPM